MLNDIWFSSLRLSVVKTPAEVCYPRTSLIQGTSAVNREFALRLSRTMIALSSKIVSMIRKYHNYKLQTSPWHREVEQHNNHETPGRQTKQSNQLKMIVTLEWTQRNVQQNIEQLQNPTMGVTINNKSTEPPP